MPVLGTKKFWKPAAGASLTQKENQILKNSGYINIQLTAVNYMSKGNFWQRIFGGRDKIALATNLKYQSGTSTLEASAIQDVREVKTDANKNLGIQRMIAVKIPANSDGLALDVKLTSIKTDQLQAKFDMLNQPEYQGAMQLAPPIVGQLVTITSLVKKLFTDSGPQNQLEASFAGVISNQAEDNPVANGKLTKGLLIIISTDDGDTFASVNESKFELRGDSLFYLNQPVQNTFMVFNITFEEFKGDDEKSNWFKKYSNALNKLDDIQLVSDKADAEKIYLDSKNMWIEGNALLEDDVTYINKEKVKIKAVILKLLVEKYKNVASQFITAAKPIVLGTDVVQAIAGATEMKGLSKMLPRTDKAFSNMGAKSGIQKFLASSLKSSFQKRESDSILDSLAQDATEYIDSLKKLKINFKLLKYSKVKTKALKKAKSKSTKTK